MAGSTLDPDLIPEPDRSLGSGHDAKSLGPSDTTDTGSDVQPGVKAVEEDDIGLDKGTTEDPDTHLVEVEGDSDSTGTGERASAGRDSVDTGSDIGTDRVDQLAPTDDMPVPNRGGNEHRQHGRP